MTIFSYLEQDIVTKSPDLVKNGLDQESCKKSDQNKFNQIVLG